VSNDFIDSFSSILLVIVTFVSGVEPADVVLTVDLKVVKDYYHANSDFFLLVVEKEHEISLDEL
jgi:hypothetical protein